MFIKTSQWRRFLGVMFRVRVVQMEHVSEGTRSVYIHAAYLDTRREMMQWFADWLDEKVS